MKEKEIKRILRKHKKTFKILEEYDKTGRLPQNIKKMKKRL